jgi:ParB/RepB/Spo0J family partition protein
MKTIRQSDLVPPKLPVTMMMNIPVEDVFFEEVGPEPSDELIKSIRLSGVRVPISVRPRPGNPEAVEQYDLIAGRRRILASIECGFEMVPAVIEIEPGEVDHIDLSALSDHALRRSNPAAELQQIQRLINDGFTPEQIAAQTGMKIGTIRARLKLLNLTEDLLSAFVEGSITFAAAEAAAKLPESAQEELSELLDESGKLTAADVKQSRKIQQRAAVQTLDDLGDLFTQHTTPSAPTKHEALDSFITEMGVNLTDVAGLARVGRTCAEIGRTADVIEILNRIEKLVG